MFRGAPREVTEPAQFERFGKTYDAIVLAVVLLVLGVHAAILSAALGSTAVAVRIVPAVLGASLLLMGNVMPRLRPNWVAGLRTERVLGNPQLWRRVHRVFGTALVLSGLATIAVALFAPRYGLLVGIASMLLSSVIGFAASLRTSGPPPREVVVAIGLLCLGASATEGQTPAIAAPTVLPTPATVAESAMTFTRDGLVLHGTLTLPRSPAGRVPVVLIVAGSRPTDRNGKRP